MQDMQLKDKKVLINSVKRQVNYTVCYIISLRVILLGFISFEHLTFICKLVLVTVNMYLEKQMIATGLLKLMHKTTK